MSKTTIALEEAVATVIENTPKEGGQSARQRANVDRAFARILKLIAPRIRHFIRQYGLVAHWDDAEQCCAIAVHRAIQAYEPEKAQFTTFVNWQLRGELQSLRFRVMTDQRPSAKKVEATTVSLHSIAVSADGEETSLEAVIEDEDALPFTEAAASEHLASGMRSALLDRYVGHLREVGLEQLKRRARATRGEQPRDPSLPRFKPKNHGIDPAELAEMEARLVEHREMVERRLFDDVSLEDLEAELGTPKERLRQAVKRAAATMAQLAADDPRFGGAEGIAKRLPTRRRRQAEPAAAPSIVIDASAPHNQLSSVAAITPDASDEAFIESAEQDEPRLEVARLVH